MAISLDPALLRDLIEAKAAVARHGIVLIRSIEEDLALAIVAAAKESIAASPKKLSQIDETDLDRYMQRLRKRAMNSAEQLTELYKRLLTRLGTENIIDLQKDLEGIGQLFTWERIVQSANEVNTVLAERGFRPIDMGDPNDLSEDFAIELQERWPGALKRFRDIATEAAHELEKEEEAEQQPAKPRRTQRRR